MTIPECMVHYQPSLDADVLFTPIPTPSRRLITRNLHRRPPVPTVSLPLPLPTGLLHPLHRRSPSDKRKLLQHRVQRILSRKPSAEQEKNIKSNLSAYSFAPSADELRKNYDHFARIQDCIVTRPKRPSAKLPVWVYHYCRETFQELLALGAVFNHMKCCCINDIVTQRFIVKTQNTFIYSVNGNKIGAAFNGSLRVDSGYLPCRENVLSLIDIDNLNLNQDNHLWNRLLLFASKVLQSPDKDDIPKNLRIMLESILYNVDSDQTNYGGGKDISGVMKHLCTFMLETGGQDYHGWRDDVSSTHDWLRCGDTALQYGKDLVDLEARKMFDGMFCDWERKRLNVVGTKLKRLGIMSWPSCVQKDHLVAKPNITRLVIGLDNLVDVFACPAIPKAANFHEYYSKNYTQEQFADAANKLDAIVSRVQQEKDIIATLDCNELALKGSDMGEYLEERGWICTYEVFGLRVYSNKEAELQRRLCKIIVHNPLCYMIMSIDGVHQTRFELMKLRCIEGEIMRQVISLACCGAMNDMILLEGHSLFEYCIKVLLLTSKASALYFKMYILAPCNIRALDPKYHGQSLTKGRGLLSKNLRRRRTQQVEGKRTDYAMVHHDAVKEITKAEKPEAISGAIDDAIKVLKSKMLPVPKIVETTNATAVVEAEAEPATYGKRKGLFFVDGKFIRGNLFTEMKSRFESRQKNTGNRKHHHVALPDEVRSTNQQIRHLIQSGERFWIRATSDTTDTTTDDQPEKGEVITRYLKKKKKEMPYTYLNIFTGKQDELRFLTHPSAVVNNITFRTAKNRVGAFANKKSINKSKKTMQQEAEYFPGYQIQKEFPNGLVIQNWTVAKFVPTK